MQKQRSNSQNRIGPPTKDLSTCLFKTIPVTPSLGAHLTCEFVKHVLFMRQQIPTTYLELEKSVLSTRAMQAAAAAAALQPSGECVRPKRKRLSGGADKKAAKAYDELQILFSSIVTLFQEQAPTMVVVALGSSPRTPLEKFALHFGYPQGGPTLGEGEKALSDHQLNLCTRKLIRGIFQNAGELFQLVIRPTKLFVVARARTADMTQSSFVVDWNLNPLKRRKGKRGVPTWIIRLRGLGSRADIVEQEEQQQEQQQEQQHEPGQVSSSSSVPVMSLTDDPAAFALVAPQVVGVPLYLLPQDGANEIWSKYPTGIKGVKGKR